MTLKFENPGYVYILSNESLKDLKIGYTQNSPYDRSFDLFTTGVPTPFFVEKYWFVEDAMLCEELIHTRLTRFRTNESREFFRVDLEKAVMASMQAMDELRERLWAKNAIKQNYKATPAQNEMPTTARTTPEQKHADEIIAAGLKPLVVQQSYNNPKFTAMMKALKESRRMLTTEEIAKAISISSKGVDALVRMMQKEGAMLYIKEEEKEGVKVKKYAMSLSFNVHQLKMLAEKFPDLDLMSLEKLFEKPVKKNESGYRNTNSKPTYPKKPENVDVPKPAQAAPQKVVTPAPQAATPQPRAAVPAAQQASRPPQQQQRPAGERSQSPAAFIQQKLEQEKQQAVAVQPQVPAAPAKPLTLKEEFMKLSKETYKELVASGKIKETQSVTRKPIKP
jgi:hypothetical protein